MNCNCWEWWLSERPRLLLLGDTQDPLLESLWPVLPEMRLFGTARTINFDLATSLNFSLYVGRPRLEHLYYLAQRHVRLCREGMRLVRETVTGNPSVVMSHSIAVYKQFLQELVDQHVERYDH